jgi:uncharacterized protein YceH (UPF0502 family)
MLARQPGSRESRYAHLLAGIPEATTSASSIPVSSRSHPDRIAQLESDLTRLSESVVALETRIAQLEGKV